MNDKRIWWPDASCQPFLWNTCENTAQDMGQFRIPQGHVGVIREVVCTETANGEPWHQNRIVLLRDDALRDEGIPVTGAITEVQQLGNAGLNHNGFAIHGAAGNRPCCIVLDEGLYTVWIANTPPAPLPPAAVAVGFSGWIFPKR